MSARAESGCARNGCSTPVRTKFDFSAVGGAEGIAVFGDEPRETGGVETGEAAAAAGAVVAAVAARLAGEHRVRELDVCTLEADGVTEKGLGVGAHVAEHGYA